MRSPGLQRSQEEMSDLLYEWQKQNFHNTLVTNIKIKGTHKDNSLTQPLGSANPGFNFKKQKARLKIIYLVFVSTRLAHSSSSTEGPACISYGPELKSAGVEDISS